MGDRTDDGRSQAIRCVDAMDGQDELTRASLWKAAVRYSQRDRGGERAADWMAAPSPIAVGRSE